MPGAQVKADLWFSEYITPFDVYQHGVRRVDVVESTAYQDLVIADIGTYGKALFLDGKLQCTSGDEALYHEPLCHVPCLLHGSPKNVLILGGGDGGAARELLKWDTIQRIDIVDIDDQVIQACKKHLSVIHHGSLHDPRVKVHATDAWAFVQKSTDQYDVILSDLTDPLEHGPSLALFTREFFLAVKGRLHHDGVFVTQAGPTSLNESPMHPRIVKTLQAVFASVYPFQAFIPSYGSPQGFAVASDKPLVVHGDAAVEAVERLIAERLGEAALRTLDGISFTGLFCLPKDVREQIKREKIVYSLKQGGFAPDTLPGARANDDDDDDGNDDGNDRNKAVDSSVSLNR
jgi:spermidine synthase